MKNLMFVIVLMLTTACSSLGELGRGPASPGYVGMGESLYDGKRFVRLVPGSLFDADNTPGVFRLGMIWDERYGDKLQLIVTFPLGKVTSISELSKSTELLKMKIGGKETILSQVKDSITISEKSIVRTEYEGSIKYKVTRRTIESMLSATQVAFRLKAENKIYEGNLYVPAGVKNRYEDVEYTAMSGLKRFHQEVWGKKK